MNDANKITSELKKIIKSYEQDVDTKEIGYVTSVGDGIANVYGLDNVGQSEVVEFADGTLGMVMNLESHKVGIIILGEEEGIEEGQIVKSTKKTISVPVGHNLLGRVVDPLGHPVDGKGDIKEEYYTNIEKKAPGIIDRQSVYEAVQTGVKIIDSLVPIGRGQRELIIGDRKTGKTSIILDTIINQSIINKNVPDDQKIFSIYVAIGQKSSTVARIVSVLEEHDALKDCIVLLSSASDSAALQYLAPYAGCAMGEYFRDKGQHALIIYDDLSKHAVAYRQISLLLRRPPGREAYPGDIFYLHSRLLERAAKMSEEKGGGSLTALPVVETQAGDVAAYIPTNVISITDGQIFLSTDLFFRGMRPAIDVGLSVSRVGNAAQTKAMKKVTGSLKGELAQYREMEAFSQFASDLDEISRKMLKKGSYITEALKQLNANPLDLASEVLTIYAVSNDLLSDIPIKKITSFYNILLEYAKKEYSSLMNKINEIKDIDDEDKKKFDEMITSCINRADYKRDN